MFKRLKNFLFGEREEKQKTFRSCCNSYTGKRYDKKYKVFKCPECRQKLRVPRAMGRIKIVCRRCRFEFVRKT
ncbi:MAG: hypothetical protein K6G45_10005 [Lachnospiraceae bacterium]|nr:hypothetical protein [Lachnospiraceae bacterium]